MNNKLSEELSSIYAYSKVMSAVFSDDVKDIFDEKCFREKWFSQILGRVIDINKEIHAFNDKTKKNIQEMLFELRFNNDSLMSADEYNELITKLNTSDDQFEMLFLSDLVRKRSFDNIESNEELRGYDFDSFLELYESDATMIEFLMCSRDEFLEYGGCLFLNESYIYSIQYLINNIPELLNDKESLYRINTIIGVNKKMLKYNPSYKKFKRNNSSLEKKIKKLTKNK